ncbi:unnamed protein product [Peronospora destructor]|uniref:Uncharacterized protein n=1 Tax=Peronospora destructor TaxID=86335 RepID=A0AAV0V7L2_9STRA|nr:unnamed protein product [Peronospora destructor]
MELDLNSRNASGGTKSNISGASQVNGDGDKITLLVSALEELNPQNALELGAFTFRAVVHGSGHTNEPQYQGRRDRHTQECSSLWRMKERWGFRRRSGCVRCLDRLQGGTRQQAGALRAVGEGKICESAAERERIG